MTEIPKVLMPQWWATMTSGTVLMPTASAPSMRIARISAGVSYWGPGKYMYTERDMRRRIRRLWFSLWRYKGIDILVTHAPARGVHDLDDLPHRGFSCFLNLLEKYEPRYFVHGHIHREYGISIPQKNSYGKTTVINACDHCVIEYDPKQER